MRGLGLGMARLNLLANRMKISGGPSARTDRGVLLTDTACVANLYDSFAENDQDTLDGSSKEEGSGAVKTSTASLLGIQMNQTRTTLCEAVGYAIREHATPAALGPGIEQVLWAMFTTCGPGTSLNAAMIRCGELLRLYSEGGIDIDDVQQYRAAKRCKLTLGEMDDVST